MIKVTIALVSAVTGVTSEIGRMFIANTGGTAERGDYEVAICRRGTTEVPAPVDMRGPAAVRSGSVVDYPRLDHNVWRLIARALLSTFPEEAKARKKRDAAFIDERVMRGLHLLRAHFVDDGHAWSVSEMSDVSAAEEWLDAANRKDNPPAVVRDDDERIGIDSSGGYTTNGKRW